MKKTWKRIGLMALAFSMSLLSGCSEKEDETKKTENQVERIELSVKQKEIAEQYTKDFIARDFDKLSKNYEYTSEMKKEIVKESFQDQLSQSLEAFGKLKEQQEPYGEGYKGSINIQIPSMFENQNLNIVISMNEQNQIQGFFIKPYQENEGSVKLPEGVKESAVNLQIDDSHILPGTLTTPDKGSGFPVVILVAGSGPNDRNETINQNKPFQDIAWGLAQQGIASYRYDKRTFVYPKEFTLKDTVKQEVTDDVLLAVSVMEKTAAVDASKIYVLGHSLSGYLIPRIAQQTKVPAGYILMAAPARPLEDLFVEQIEFLAREDGKISDEEQNVITKYTEDRNKVKQIDKMSNTEVVFGALSKAYMNDLKGYDPIDTAKTIDKKVMVAQGLRDYQVTEEDYALWKNAYDKSENWSFHTYKNANHIFIDGTGKASSADYQNKGNVTKSFVNDIVKFIQK